MTGLLSPKSSEIRHFFCIFLVVYRSSYSSLTQVIGEGFISLIEEPPKQTWWASMVARISKVLLLCFSFLRGRQPKIYAHVPLVMAYFSPNICILRLRLSKKPAQWCSMYAIVILV